MAGFIGRQLNPTTLRLAREGKSNGPMKFWIVRHVGRKSGKTYETPIMLAPVPGGFIAELTYGDEVQWYQKGRAAFGRFARVVLTLLRRREFRFLRAAF